LYISVGCFASALTRSQAMAAAIALSIGLSLMLLSFLARALTSASEFVGDILGYISMFDHMEDFSRGIVDTRHVAFYLTTALFFLFLTYRVVESRRWK
jgi:ABC-2 type transport system permease protein